MTIETKLGIGDMCYTIYANKGYSFVVKRISISVGSGVIDVSYYDDECRQWFNESGCFASKEELIASL